MNTQTPLPAIDPQTLADLEAVCRQVAGGGILHDPELDRRIEERVAQARQELVERLGVQEFSAQIIREMREAR